MVISSILTDKLLVLWLLSGILVCSDIDQWGQQTEFIHSRYLCDPILQTSPPPCKRKVDGFSLHLQMLLLMQKESVLSLISSVVADVKIPNRWLRTGLESEDGGALSVLPWAVHHWSPLSLRNKPHLLPWENLGVMPQDSSVRQVKYAGITYCPKMTAKFSSNSCTPSPQWNNIMK